MGIEMQVLRTYDGSQSGDTVVKEGPTESRNGLVVEGAVVEVEDKQRAALLEQFGIAKPVDEDVNLDLPNYTEADLNQMKQPQLREIAKGLGVEGYGSMTNDELRKTILDVQGEPADENTNTAGGTDPDENTGALTTPNGAATAPDATNGAEGTAPDGDAPDATENDSEPENK